MLRTTEIPSLLQRKVARARSFQRARQSMIHTEIVLLLLLVAGFAQWPRAAFAHGYEAPPAEFSAAACYGLVQAAGRPIAWARWEKHLSLSETRAAPFRPNTPPWVIDLVKGWVEDAYQWRATDEQIHQWAAELGSVEDLPSVDTLSVHERIAIWMRRLGRLCDEAEVRVGTSANLAGRDFRSEQ